MITQSHVHKNYPISCPKRTTTFQDVAFFNLVMYSKLQKKLFEYIFLNFIAVVIFYLCRSVNSMWPVKVLACAMMLIKTDITSCCCLLYIKTFAQFYVEF